MTEDFPAKKIYGLIGYPVEHSLSPAMHNAAFRYLKEQGKIDYDAEYRLFEVSPEELEDFLLKDIEVNDIAGKSVWTADISGFNITIPHKVRAKEILEKNFPFPPSEEIFHNVKVSGAVNTVRRMDMAYFNTDIYGFLYSLEKDLNFDVKDKKVFLIGCGGAGRAVIAALTWKRAHTKIYVYENNNETAESAQAYFFKELSPTFSFLKDRLEFISEEHIPRIIDSCQLLVNATPVGMKETDGSVIDKNSLRKDLFVYDLIYNRKTQLIKDAELSGCVAKGGLGMLLYQGVYAFKIWTGEDAPVEVMRRALMEAMNK